MTRFPLLALLPALLAVTVMAAGQPDHAPASSAASAPSAPADRSPNDAPRDKAAQDPTPASPPPAQRSAEQVMEELLKRRTENPLIEPVLSPAPDKAAGTQEPAGQATRPAGATALGTAPALPVGQLKREGSFVLNRRGRLVRAGNQAAGWMFVFEADKDGMQDPPMYLMPCQMLEDMENLAARHDRSLVFILSGQVFVYHKANYLLPTMMRIAAHRGNIQR